MNDKVKVIFRKDGHGENREVFAMFPELPGDHNPFNTCLCYSRVGQHGAVALDYDSLPASPEEYAPLLAELESIGYNLRTAKRMTYKDHQKRIKASKGV